MKDEQNRAKEYLIKNGHNDIVHNAEQYPTNTPENADKWVYTSDLLTDYAKQYESEELQKLREENDFKDKQINLLKIDCNSFEAELKQKDELIEKIRGLTENNPYDWNYTILELLNK